MLRKLLADRDPAGALELLNHAWASRRATDGNWDEGDFVIVFGKTVAYDQLGQDVSAAHELDLVEPGSHGIFRRAAELPTADDLESIGLLSGIASLAPSQNMRRITIDCQQNGERGICSVPVSTAGRRFFTRKGA